MRALLFTLCVLLAASAEAVTRKELVASMQQTTPGLMCDADRYGACFAAPRDRCVTKANAALAACLKTNAKHLPAEIPTLNAARLVRRMTACTGARLRKELPLAKPTPTRCGELASPATP